MQVQEVAARLALTVGCHPLALACLGIKLCNVRRLGQSEDAEREQWEDAEREYQSILAVPDLRPLGAARTVTAAIRLSVDALGNEERRMLSFLATFRMPVPRIIVQKAWQSRSSVSASVLLDQLVSRHHAAAQPITFFWGELELLHLHDLRLQYLRSVVAMRSILPAFLLPAMRMGLLAGTAAVLLCSGRPVSAASGFLGYCVWLAYKVDPRRRPLQMVLKSIFGGEEKQPANALVFYTLMAMVPLINDAAICGVAKEVGCR